MLAQNSNGRIVYGTCIKFFKALSAVQVQQLAAAVVRDNGITNPIRALAGLGCGGRFPSKCGRYYARFVTNRLKFPGMVLPYQIVIPITKLEGLCTDYKPAFVLLPHEVFSTLHGQWPT